MATLEDSASMPTPVRPAILLARLRWPQILAISIFWLALNFHWAALGIIIVPDQVLKIVGSANKGLGLAYVLVPGAFVSLLANPFFGMLSDRTRGRLAAWGRRRPYILLGTLVNVAALIWMALAGDIFSLAAAYALVQFSSNAAQAPFHALLPDIVPEAQRGLASGVMGFLATIGTVGGVIVAGMLIHVDRPLIEYQQSLWLTYGIVIAILVMLMLITIVSVHESRGRSAQLKAQEEQLLHQNPISAGTAPSEPTELPWFRRIRRSTVINVLGTLLVTGIAWGLIALWNLGHNGPGANLQINGDFTQVILEIIVTVGLLRLFDFNPRRDPDFAWVLLTRLVMMLGIYTIQTYLLYYMRDAVGVKDPEQQTTNFVIIVSLTSVVSALAAGWLSDRFGRKRMVYFSGGFMALVGFIFIITHSLPIVLAAGGIFGLGYGAYQSVDWALVADVLPSRHNYARDMGVWNISLSLPQVIAPVIGGPLIDSFARAGHPIIGYQVIFGLAILYCLIGTVAVRNIRGVKK